jgi:hypothetical protein
MRLPGQVGGHFRIVEPSSGKAGKWKWPAVAGWRPNRDSPQPLRCERRCCNRPLLDLIRGPQLPIRSPNRPGTRRRHSCFKSQENTGGQASIPSSTWGPPRVHHRGMQAPDLIREGRWGRSSREQRSRDAACVAGIRLGLGVSVTIPKSENGRLYHRRATRQDLLLGHRQACALNQDS